MILDYNFDLVQPTYFITSSYGPHVWSWLTTVSASSACSSTQLFLLLRVKVIFQLYQLSTLDCVGGIPPHLLSFQPFTRSAQPSPASGSLRIHFSACSFFFLSLLVLHDHCLLGPTLKHNLSAPGSFLLFNSSPVQFPKPIMLSLFFTNPQFHVVLSEIYYLL